MLRQLLFASKVIIPTLFFVFIMSNFGTENEDIVLLPTATKTSTVTPTPTEPSFTATPSSTPTITPTLETIGAPVVARERAIIRSGPGITFEQLGRVALNEDIHVLERNKLGDWMRIRVERDKQTLEGWVVAGYLMLDDGVTFDNVPRNDTIVDADPENENSLSLSELYTAPIIPEISPEMRSVYQLGQELGNEGQVVTKIGDSLSASPIYLIAMSKENPELGPYDHLAETVDYFGESTAGIYIASRVGLSSIAVFDPLWADPKYCEPNESPLICEYRRKRPAVALILFGPNDVRSMDTERYTEQMRRIVEVSLAYGIIPVLSTFSVDPDEQYWWPSINFNLALMSVAEEYKVPLVNLWAAARILPNYGLDRDRIHLMHSGRENLYFRDGHPAYYGVTLQNLVAVTVLDEIRRSLELE